jgi:hypothetical protein
MPALVAWKGEISSLREFIIIASNKIPFSSYIIIIDYKSCSYVTFYCLQWLAGGVFWIGSEQEEIIKYEMNCSREITDIRGGSRVNNVKPKLLPYFT